ncbi:hypothetical protein RJ639_014578 [Escallonia herrerae]|uniref:Integrase catalytic domain-containing protein n=1 Tax=Escallonia herrerae TaxID=1293975 RepID=A0AA89ALI2_9ASTE|nr:hypothetical protein RJ639_014578 [Escallonia herrerae]
MDLSTDDDEFLLMDFIFIRENAIVFVLLVPKPLPPPFSKGFNFPSLLTRGSTKRVSFKAASHTSKGVLDYVHMDVWGPIKHVSNGGAHYFVTFIDDFSRKVWVYSMKHKSEVFDVFKQWKARVKNHTGKKLKYFRSNNGMEYKDDEFLQFCKDKDIIRHFSVKRTPEHNGVAERMNRTLLEQARCMGMNASLPKSFWAEVVNTTCYLINRSPIFAINHQVLKERRSPSLAQPPCSAADPSLAQSRCSALFRRTPMKPSSSPNLEVPNSIASRLPKYEAHPNLNAGVDPRC